MKNIFVYLKVFLLIALLQLTQVSFAAKEKVTPADKRITIEKHAIFYNDVGTGVPIVLVHGLFANKEQWNGLVPLLSTHYRVIALDLPGYGQSLGFPFADYDLNKQVKLLHEFLAKLGVYQFHIAGNSMGGAIAALYTAQYPHDILSLAFIGSPLGIISPQLSETNLLFDKGGNPFLPTDKKGVELLMHLLFVHPPALNDTQINAIIEDNKKNFAQKNKISKEVIGPFRASLDKPLGIQKPTLILWGNEDRIFDISGAQKLKANFKESDLIILKGTGHLPQVECAHTTAETYLHFLETFKVKTDHSTMTQEVACVS